MARCHPTEDSTSTNVIRCLRRIFIRFGLPCEIVTDNKVQFTCNEFTQFCENNGIRHSRSSVYHARSNEEAERMVQTFKRSMKSNEQPVEKRLEVFLFTYRTTPHATTGCSPAELLMGRPLKVDSTSSALIKRIPSMPLSTDNDSSSIKM